MGTTISGEIWLEQERDGDDGAGDRDGLRDGSRDGWTDVEREWLTSSPYDREEGEPTRALVRRIKRGEDIPRRLEMLSDAPQFLFRLEPLSRGGRRPKPPARQRTRER